jgi:threonine aldolase
MTMINLISDTVTEPTQAMRTAMSFAAVGDDVSQEDPTVNQLQEMAAKRMGKEAGLFIPSGTMGNLLAVMVHCARGDEMILGNNMHTFLYEGGGSAVLGSVHSYTLPTQADGTLLLSDIEQAIRDESDDHCPVSRLIVLENTHNRCAGVSLSAAYTRQVAALARKNKLKLHIDGARIFNAAIDQQCDVRELTDPADSVTFCLSKGLCAPVGSVLCGSEEFIHKARHLRKMLGGGMRQAGIIAAAGIVALESMVDRLAEDHRRAKTLADAIRDMKSENVASVEQHTNMIYLQLKDYARFDGDQLVKKMNALGVRFSAINARSVRLVTHYWIDDAAIDQTVTAFSKVLL